MSPEGLKAGKRDEKESAEITLESRDHRMDAETVKRGYSFDGGHREDGVEDAVRIVGTKEHTLQLKPSAKGIILRTIQSQATKWKCLLETMTKRVDGHSGQGHHR